LEEKQQVVIFPKGVSGKGISYFPLLLGCWLPGCRLIGYRLIGYRLIGCRLPAAG